MRVFKLLKVLRAVHSISKVAIPIIEEFIQKDINKDGVIGREKPYTKNELDNLEDTLKDVSKNS